MRERDAPDFAFGSIRATRYTEPQYVQTLVQRQPYGVQTRA
jgi:hypothetical protein